jgi:hypothetical protein
MQVARTTPATLSDLMLAGHSASSCDLSLSVEGFSLAVQDWEKSQCRDVQDLEKSQSRRDIASSDGKASSDESTLPAPRKFCKKLIGHDFCQDMIPPFATNEVKRSFRRAMGLAIVSHEAANWASCPEMLQASAHNVSMLIVNSSSDNHD